MLMLMLGISCHNYPAVGSLMNAKWVASKAVTYEPFCEAQGGDRVLASRRINAYNGIGVMKQLADVGTAIW